MTREEHSAVLRVLRMVDTFLEAQPATTLTASKDGGLMTWGDLRRHVGGAIRIVEAVKPSAPRGKR